MTIVSATSYSNHSPKGPFLMAATAPCLVRPARADDWPAVAALLEGLGRPAVLAGNDAVRHGDLFVLYLARADASALVAEVGGVVVGFVDVEFRQRLNHSTRQAWIPDLVVEESHRGRGVGRALLARAEELARQRGCWGMALESAKWRQRAHAFYRARGWRDASLSFTMPLGETPMRCRSASESP
ncbi:MAG: GNAT family N-acetyltransferase [Actinomycetota bacterium]|nr:GNAT family N-acetyltransferase [Actinomycetota bacterium]